MTAVYFDHFGSPMPRCKCGKQWRMISDTEMIKTCDCKRSKPKYYKNYTLVSDFRITVCEEDSPYNNMWNDVIKNIKNEQPNNKNIKK